MTVRRPVPMRYHPRLAAALPCSLSSSERAVPASQPGRPRPRCAVGVTRAVGRSPRMRPRPRPGHRPSVLRHRPSIRTSSARTAGSSRIGHDGLHRDDHDRLGRLPAGCINRHVWRYEVAPDRTVRLVEETGEPLPGTFRAPVRRAGDRRLCLAGPVCPSSPTRPIRPAATARSPVRWSSCAMPAARDRPGNDGRRREVLDPARPGSYTVEAQPVERLMARPVRSRHRARRRDAAGPGRPRLRHGIADPPRRPRRRGPGRPPRTTRRAGMPPASYNPAR